MLGKCVEILQLLLRLPRSRTEKIADSAELTCRDFKKSVARFRPARNARVQHRPNVHPAKRQVARKNGYVKECIINKHV